MPQNNGSSVLTLSGNSAAGSYTFDVEASSTFGNKTINIMLEIEAPAPIAPTLQFPADGMTDMNGIVPFNWSDASGVNVIYEIEISDDSAFSNIIYSNNSLTSSEIDQGNFNSSTTYYWRVRAMNSCGQSLYSAVFSFTTGNCQLVVSQDVPNTLPFFGTNTYTSTLNYTGTGSVIDINVINLIGTHIRISDLKVSLTSPEGTTVVLFDQICDRDDDFNVNFDDAAISSTLPCPPKDGGFYQPDGFLASFNGEDPTGIWTLTVEDKRNRAGGELTNWALEICESPVCLADIVITDTHNTGMIIDEGSNSITSSEMIGGNAEVDYSAGQEINLTAGFFVDQGAMLHAYILGCRP